MNQVQGKIWRCVPRFSSASRFGKSLSERACQVVALLVTCLAAGELVAQDDVTRIDDISSGTKGGSVSSGGLHQNDWYTFMLSDSGSVSAKATFSGEFTSDVADLYLCLYDSSVRRGAAEGTKCDATSLDANGLLAKSPGEKPGDDAAIWALGPGTYYIRVDLSSGSSTDGNVGYTLTYSLEASPDLRASTNVLALDENSTGFYTVVLTRPPSGNVPVDVTSEDPAAVTVSLGDSARRGNSVRLTFTRMNWNSAQTVTVHAEDDDDTDDETVTISNRMTALLLTGSEAILRPVTVQVRDDDTRGVLVSPETLTVVEEESTDTYTVVLQSRPQGTVTVTPHSAGSKLGFSPERLTFDAGNWNSEQTVTVSATPDDDASDSVETVSHDVTGYGDVVVDFIEVTVIDNDQAGVRLSSDSLTIEEGGSSIYEVSLRSAPPGNVTITLSSDNTDVVEVDPQSVTFTSSDWMSPKEITVTAKEDDDAIGETATISHDVVGYGEVRSARDVTVTVTDTYTVTVPGPPRYLTATPGNRQVSLQWREPASDGGSPITRYDYQVDDGAWMSTGGTETGYVVRSLVNGTTYAFRVRAVNAFSEESPTSESVSAADRATPTVSKEAVEAVTATVEAVTAAAAANITSNIGTRFAAAPSSGSVVVVGGRTLSLGSARTELDLPAAIGRKQNLLAESDRVDESWSLGIDDLLRSSAFDISLSAAEDDIGMGAGATQWTFWGRGDVQYFESRPERGSTYDGGLTAGYLGIDGRLYDRWLAGLAVSGTRADADYDTGVNGSAEDGRLEITLTGVHPYLSYAAGARTELWTILGAGEGEIENTSASDMTRERSDMRMLMGAAGIRYSRDPIEALNVAYLSDVGFARVETDTGLEAIDGLTVDTWRLRMGVEASHTAELENGADFSSFVEVAGRIDGGGDGEEAGVEISPGFYISDPDVGVGVELRGRLLAMHSAENYEERGVSVTASLSPRPGEPGLSLSLSPRWGTSTGDAANLWRDHALERLNSSDVQRDALSFDARLGYGLRSMDGLLTPFGEYGLRDEDSRQVRVGAQFARQSRSFGNLSVELSGERRDNSWNDSEHRVSLVARLRF